jgi:enamine deaminase RidA (YjgF/YER057c/UK114 family)
MSKLNPKSRRLQEPPEAILATTLEPGGIAYAPGVRAGQWVFATGHKGTDYRNGMAPAVLAQGMPQFDKPVHAREAQRLFKNISAVMRAAGTNLSNVVRVDQYYTDHRSVDPYHEVRRAAFRGRIPPSTSNLHQRFLLPSQAIEMHAIGVVPDDTFRPHHTTVDDWAVHPSSGYSHALRCGDLVFAAGMTAEALITAEGPIDPQARMPAGHLWKGTPIKLETEFIIARKLIPTLEAAGTGLERVAKAQVYLRDEADFAPFLDVWRKHFPGGPPATTLIPTATPGFIVEQERIEINTLSVAGDAPLPMRFDIDGVTVPFAGLPAAVRAGDLLLLSGMMAVDRTGLVPAARPDPRQPFFGSSIRTQMEHILDRAEQICEAAGTSLRNLVRVQQFHTDLHDFYPAYRAWHERRNGQPLPFSAIEVPFLPVPDCSVLLDIWVHIPGQ